MTNDIFLNTQRGRYIQANEIHLIEPIDGDDKNMTCTTDLGKYRISRRILGLDLPPILTKPARAKAK